MRKPRALRNSRDTQLLAIAGLVSGLMSLGQLNLSEIIRWDRFQHSFVSMILFFLIYGLLKQEKHRWLIAIGTTLIIGFLKEAFDPQVQTFDLIANTTGLTTAILITLATKTPIPRTQWWTQKPN